MGTESALERLLAEAATDPGRRPDFYRVLPLYPLFVAGHRDGALLRVRDVAGPDGPAVAVFTSLARMLQAFPPGTPWLSVQGAALFASLPAGSRAVLNPCSPISKDLTADEVRWLAGSGAPGAEPFVVPAGEEVLVGRPTGRPAQLLTALASLFRRRPAVVEAWVAQLALPSGAEPPHLVVGVRLDPGADFEPVARDAGAVAREVLRAGEVLDLVEVGARSGAGIGDHIAAHGDRFYRRG